MVRGLGWGLGSGLGLERATGTTGEEDVKWQRQLRRRRRKGEKEEAIPLIRDQMLLMDPEVLEIHIVQLEQRGKRWETNPTGQE